MLSITQPQGLLALPLRLKAAVDVLTTITSQQVFNLETNNCPRHYFCPSVKEGCWDVISISSWAKYTGYPKDLKAVARASWRGVGGHCWEAAERQDLTHLCPHCLDHLPQPLVPDPVLGIWPLRTGNIRWRRLTKMWFYFLSVLATGIITEISKLETLGIWITVLRGSALCSENIWFEHLTSAPGPRQVSLK